MARIRSIKPELRTSLVAAEWPRDVRYTWVLLWGYLDDHGRGVDNSKLIAADLFPLDDDVTAAVMDDWLGVIATAGPLCRYQVNGKRYLHATNWRDHQKPSHPTPSRAPACPIHEGGTASTAPPENFANNSGAAQEALRPEQVRGAGSREQGRGPRASAEPPPSLEALNDPQSTLDQLPPERCAKHRDIERPPPCGQCKDARRAYELAAATIGNQGDRQLAELRARRDAIPWCGDCDGPQHRWTEGARGTARCPRCNPDVVVGPLTGRHLAAVAR